MKTNQTGGMDRGDFLGLLGGAWLGLAACGGKPGRLFSAMGIAASLERAAQLKAAGAEFLTESVGRFLVPDRPEEEFLKKLEQLAASPLSVRACNGFIRDKRLRCVGPEAVPDAVLEWAGIVFERARRARVEMIVFGSNSARQVPEGWAREKADGQFVELLKRMGPLAEAQKVTVVVEQLRSAECNYLNKIGETSAVVRAAGHPNIRLLADLYHMAHEADTPEDLRAAMDVVAHVEIAEKEGRTVPGVAGDDFRPFFRVLREAGYRGAVGIEGKWEMGQVAGAFREIKRQAGEV